MWFISYRTYWVALVTAKASHFVLSKIVLTLVLRADAVVYGMDWAVVKTGEAGEAVAVVNPLGHAPLATADVAYGAGVHTLATLQTLRRVDMERAVGDQFGGEESAYHTAVDARPTADVGAVAERTAMDDVVYHAVKSYLRRLYLLALALNGVYIHKW